VSGTRFLPLPANLEQFVRRLTLSVFAVLSTLPLAAQQNPFKPTKLGIKGAQVSYSLTGDIVGTSTLALDPERMVRRQTSTMKMMGKSVSTDTWTLTTPDSMYTADLTKKTGTVSANILPSLEKAYDNLDDPAKQRFYENAKDMASVLARGFGVSTLSEVGAGTGKKSYAGQECEERQFGSFNICMMKRAPISLHSRGTLICVNFEETATAVALSAPGGEAFSMPAGVTWTANTHLQNADSMAIGYVLYLSSQQLADSLAKAKAQIAQASAGGASGAQPTPEQQASMQQACEVLKSFDVGKVMADATSQLGKEIAEAMKRAALDAAKNAATSKLKGLLKKPRIP
jgi:hypothetical protein